ncbi:hypothetical protein [Streptomyces sp. NPDC000410]|uniref:hypothetical protein n=1 Tax=Streptomyces sp. NPDC000410 TaxID=3154254 RepID=UPI00332D8AEB
MTTNTPADATNTLADATDAPADATDATDATDAEGHMSVRALRVTAGIGLGVLLLAFLLTVGIIVDGAVGHGDDHVAPSAIEASMWSLGLSGAAGLGAAAIPRGAIPRRVRAGAVVAQYGLMFAGPIVALIG